MEGEQDLDCEDTPRDQKRFAVRAHDELDNKEEMEYEDKIRHFDYAALDVISDDEEKRTPKPSKRPHIEKSAQSDVEMDDFDEKHVDAVDNRNGSMEQSEAEWINGFFDACEQGVSALSKALTRQHHQNPPDEKKHGDLNANIPFPLSCLSGLTNSSMRSELQNLWVSAIANGDVGEFLRIGECLFDAVDSRDAATSLRNDQGQCALHILAQSHCSYASSDDFQLVLRSLQSMCRDGVDMRDRNGLTPLHCLCGQTLEAEKAQDLLRFLLDHNANVNLHTANHRQETCLTLLFPDNLDIRLLGMPFSNFFTLLVDSRADVHATNAAGLTPLHLLVSMFNVRHQITADDEIGHLPFLHQTFIRTVEQCLERGADVRVFSESCFDSLSLVEWMAHPVYLTLLQVLFAFGADVHHRVACFQDFHFETVIEYPLSFLNHALGLYREVFAGICDLSSAICTGLELARSLRNLRYRTLLRCESIFAISFLPTSSLSLLFAITGLVRIISDYATIDISTEDLSFMQNVNVVYGAHSFAKPGA